MRELTLNDTLAISGGIVSNGYNFSFIVSNSVFVGIITGVLAGNFNVGAAIGASYAGLMMVANIADNYTFKDNYYYYY